MNRIVPIILLAATAGLAACGADEPADDRRPAFGQAQGRAESEAARFADGNRDGRVTREEATADPMLSASFDRFDTDDNDELDRAEFARLEAQAVEGRRAARADGNAGTQRSSRRPRDEFPRPQD